jgi:hypothetical protein
MTPPHPQRGVFAAALLLTVGAVLSDRPLKQKNKNPVTHRQPIRYIRFQIRCEPNPNDPPPTHPLHPLQNPLLTTSAANQSPTPHHQPIRYIRFKIRC